MNSFPPTPEEPPTASVSRLRLSSLASRPLVLVLLIGLAARIVCLVLWHYQLSGTPFGFADSYSYWQLAADLARGEPYEYGWSEAQCFRTPGYPLLLAPLFLIWQAPSILAARAINVVLGVGIIALTYCLAQRLFASHTAASDTTASSSRARSCLSHRAAPLLAALGVALSPELILSSVLVLTETPFTFLLLVQLHLWLTLHSRPQSTSLALAAGGLGVVTALATLVRPSWLPAIVVWSLALLVLQQPTISPLVPSNYRPWSFRQRLIPLGVMLLMFTATASPWWVRNSLIYGAFVPTTLQTGASLWDGLHPGANGGSDMSGIDQERLNFLRTECLRVASPEQAQQWLAPLPASANDPDYWPRIKTHLPALWLKLQQQDPLLPRFELAFDRHLGRSAKQYALANPGESLKLAVSKLRRTWSPWPQDSLGRSFAARVVFGLGFLALALGLGAAMLSGVRVPSLWLLWLPALYFTLLHMIYVASIRYREPALPGLFIIASLGWTRLAAGASQLVGQDGRD